MIPFIKCVAVNVDVLIWIFFAMFLFGFVQCLEKKGQTVLESIKKCLQKLIKCTFKFNEINLQTINLQCLYIYIHTQRREHHSTY